MDILIDFLNKRESIKDKTAFIDKKGNMYSYKKFYNDIGLIIKKLKSNGIKKGDKVIVFMMPCYELYVSLIAVLCMGCSIVFVDFWSNRKRIKQIISETNSSAILLNNKTKVLSTFIKDINYISKKIVINTCEDSECDIQIDIEDVSLNDEAIIVYTTGSTGNPKKVIRTYEVLDAQFTLLLDNLTLPDEDVIMCGLPMHTLALIILGQTIVIPNTKARLKKGFNCDKIHQQLKKFNVSMILHSGYFFERLSQSKVDFSDCTKLSTVYTGGSFYKIEDFIRLNERLNVNVNLIYGSTEAFLFSKISNKEYIDLYDTLEGVPMGSKLKGLIYKVFRDDKVYEQGTGELVIAGKSVCPSNPITIENIVYHRTGDIVNIVNDNIYVYGRKKFSFKINEKDFYPLALEKSLYNDCSYLKGCAYIKKDNRITLFVELHKKHNIKKLEKDLKEKSINMGVCVDNVIPIKLPKDSRHNSRIDYEELYNNAENYYF